MNTTSLPSKLFLSLGLALGTLGLAAAPGGAMAAESSVGETLDDASITATVKARLIEDPLTEGFDINVSTQRGVVTLTGGADSAAAKQAATRIAQSAKGVARVDNQIVVAPEGTLARTEANTATLSGELRKGAEQAAEATGDAWLSTKVKTQLLAEKDIDGSAITVKTEGKVVHLTGVLPTQAMKARAILVAETTEGVAAVRADNLVVRGG
jgi:hyperosmotically inducible periplasmic protein